MKDVQLDLETQELVKGCLKGDRRSQNTLYKKYFPLMSSIVVRYVNDENEEMPLLNGAFLKVLDNLKTYNQDLPFSSWVRRIFVNHCIDDFRKRQKEVKNINLEDVEDENLGFDLNIGEVTFEETDELRDMLKSLPNVTRHVFNLFAIDGYKHKEISEKLSISEGTSKWHINNARKILMGKINRKVAVNSKTQTIEK